MAELTIIELSKI